MAKKSKSNDKMAKINAIVKAVEKTYGEGSAFALGNNEPTQVPRFSSQCGVLDDAMGGGYPWGRIVEISGNESSGKCLTSDTYVYGENGLVTIDEMFVDSGKKATCVHKKENVSYGLIDETGNLQKTSCFTWNNRKRVRKIISKRGLEIESTDNHPIRVFDNGFVVWKKTSEIKVGDKILVQKGMMVDTGKELIDKDDAELIAMVLAESHHVNNVRIIFSNTDRSLIDSFKRIFSDKFSFSGFKEYEDKRREESVFSVHANIQNIVKDFQNRYGIVGHNSEGKSVPRCIRSSSLSVQKAFLRMFFICDGYNCGTRELEISSKSKGMLRQIQLMILNIGCFGYLSNKYIDGEKYGRLNVSGVDYDRFIDFIYDGEYDYSKLKKSDCSVETTHSIIPDSIIPSIIHEDCINPDRKLSKLVNDCKMKKCELTERRVREILSLASSYSFGPTAAMMLKYLALVLDRGWCFDVVESVEYCGDKPTFDVVIEPTHTFWSNGFVSHNTTMCLHAISEVQKKMPDDICAFIDSENSLDLSYSKALGVNTDELIVSQPETGEQSLNLVLDFMKMGVKLIVVDSVASLTPAVEVEGEIGKQTIGLQARMMSQSMRKMTSPIRRYGACVIFTNQIREKIGVMYGNPETTPGGRALKFYASVRLMLRRMKTIMEGSGVNKIPIGNTVSATVVKNKTAAPFKKCIFTISYGVGVDAVTDVAGQAVEKEVIEKSGAWFTIGEARFHGLSSVIDFLRSDDSTLELVREALKDPGAIDKLKGVVAPEESIDVIEDSVVVETITASDDEPSLDNDDTSVESV